MNLKEMAENIGLEEEEFKELIELFIETGISDLNKLELAIKSGDRGNAANAAHSLKGAAGNLGLMDIFGSASQIEENSRTGDFKGVMELVHILQIRLGEIESSILR